MSALAEEVDVKKSKSKNIDCNDGEAVQSIDMESQNSEVNSNVAKNCINDENNTQSAHSSSDEKNKESAYNSSNENDTAVAQNCNDQKKVSQNDQELPMVCVDQNDYESSKDFDDNSTKTKMDIDSPKQNEKTDCNDFHENNGSLIEQNATDPNNDSNISKSHNIEEDKNPISCEEINSQTNTVENILSDDDESVEERNIKYTKDDDVGRTAIACISLTEPDSEEEPNITNGGNEIETVETAMEISDIHDDNTSQNNVHENSLLLDSMDVDSPSLNSTDAGNSTESMGATDLSSKEDNASKIKLRSFASLCDDEDPPKPIIKNNTDRSSPEVSGLSVGDIVEHSNIVEHDESGVLHLKITDVVGKEECITGISEDDTLSSLQITSVVSLTEPMSPEEPQDSNESQLKITSIGTVSDSSLTSMSSAEKKTQIVVIYKNRLVVGTTCIACRKQCICKFRILYRPAKPYIKFPYLCTDKCKENFISILPSNHKVDKPNRFFERLCSMCDTILKPKDIVHWQTREFCDKLCLADHIGEVARHCYECSTAVKVLFMGKYCVRFGSDIHQFCSNHCLESYKVKVDACTYCQKNLINVEKVVSEPPKKYCSVMCLRRAQREDIGQMNYALNEKCTVCQKVKVNQYEFLNNNETVLLCSNPCLSVYKYVNQAKAVNCCMCSRFVNAEEFPNYFYTNNQLRVFCSESCLSVFIITARRVVSCQYCKVKKYNFDMIQKSALDAFYCSICCLNLTETDRGKQIESVELDSNADPKSVIDDTKSREQDPIIKTCQMCNKHMPAQFHMVMSDSTLRSFCSYDCACKFKNNFGYQVSGVNIAAKGDAIIATETVPQTVSPITKPAKKATNKQGVKVDFQALANILKEFEPPEMSNKGTSCKPYSTTIAIQSGPTMCNKSVETDENGAPPFVPVPFPIFIPAPMMMYSANVPIPLILPIPIPVPVFIPTTEKTTEDILNRMNKIQNEIPDDPIQAELLLLAKGQEVEMQQELESQITEEELQTPQMVLEEPDEILTFVDNDEDLSQLNDSINKFICEEQTAEETRKGKKKRPKSYDENVPVAKKQKALDDTLNTSYGLSVWIDWVRKKNAELKSKFSGGVINEDLVQINSEAMNECLSMFLLDLEQNNDREYDIDTIFYLLLGIQKVMFERGSTFCIFLEDRFEKFACTFDKMITRYLNRKYNSEILGFQMLNGSRITEDMLWQCRQLGAHTPYVLLNTLFYFSTKCFKLRSVDDHMALSFSQVIKQWRRASMVEGTYTRTTLLKYFPRQAHFDKTELEMHENRIDPLKCPVKLYEFYLSKCPESVRQQQGLYYVYPETCCMPDSPVWFSTGPLSAITIERMLHRVQLVKEIQEALYH